MFLHLSPLSFDEFRLINTYLYDENDYKKQIIIKLMIYLPCNYKFLKNLNESLISSEFE